MPSLTEHSSSSRDSSSTTKRRRLQYEHDDDEEHQQIQLNENSKSPEKRKSNEADAVQSPVSASVPNLAAQLVVRPRSNLTPERIQVLPYGGQAQPIFSGLQDEQEESPHIKAEHGDVDDDIQMFTSPTTPFKNKGTAGSEQPDVIKEPALPISQNSPLPSGGVRVGRHTFYFSRSENSTTRLSTPSGSRTLSLGIDTQAQPILSTQQQGGSCQVLQTQQPAKPKNKERSNANSTALSLLSKGKSSGKRVSTHRGKKHGKKTQKLKPFLAQKELMAQWRKPDAEQEYNCKSCGAWFKYSENSLGACPPMHPGKIWHSRSTIPRLPDRANSLLRLQDPRPSRRGDKNGSPERHAEPQLPLGLLRFENRSTG